MQDYTVISLHNHQDAKIQKFVSTTIQSVDENVEKLKFFSFLEGVYIAINLWEKMSW